MNSIYIGKFKSYFVIHQNSLPFTNSEIKKYKNKLFKYKIFTQRYLLKKTYLNSLCTIFLTSYAKNLVEKFLKKKIDSEIIPLGIQEYFNRFPKNNNKLNKVYNSLSEIKILYVSSLHLYKNHTILIKAIKLLLSEYPNIELTLIGEKINFIFDHIQKEFQKLPIKNCKYIEKVDNYSLKNFHAETDLFIFPSTCETFPLSLLEAMKSSVPILVSNYIKEINVVNEEVISFNPYNPIDIAEKIKYIIRNYSLKKDIVIKSHNFVNNYNWKETIIKINRVIENYK